MDEDRRREFWGSQNKIMAPQVGLEPTTLRLTAGCSAIELLRSIAWARKRRYLVVESIVTRLDLHVKIPQSFSLNPRNSARKTPPASQVASHFLQQFYRSAAPPIRIP